MTNIIINGKEIKKTSEITACQKETIIKGSSLYDQDRKGHYLFKEGQSFKIEPFTIGHSTKLLKNCIKQFLKEIIFAIQIQVNSSFFQRKGKFRKEDLLNK